MTENKRFLIDDAGELIDFDNHKFIDYGDECCKLLNEYETKCEVMEKKLNELGYHLMHSVPEDAPENEEWVVLKTLNGKGM